jgi:hypothetical protein
MIVDGDGHPFEPATMWRDYSPAEHRQQALSIEPDAQDKRLNDPYEIAASFNLARLL